VICPEEEDTILLGSSIESADENMLLGKQLLLLLVFSSNSKSLKVIEIMSSSSLSIIIGFGDSSFLSHVDIKNGKMHKK
jgi:hypothetical protein